MSIPKVGNNPRSRRKDGRFRCKRSDAGKPRLLEVSKETRQKQSEARKRVWRGKQPKKHHMVIP